MDEAGGPPPRRALLTGSLAVAAAGALSACSAFDTGSRTASVGPRPDADAPNPRPTTPDTALARLMEGNARWVTGKLKHPDRDPDRRELLAQTQEPYGVVLACIDSRVPPEMVFDTGLGDLYVLRTGGQTVGPVVTGSVEYGPMTSATPLIVVMGHQRCGAIDAAYKAMRDGKTLPGNLEAIAKALRPAYDRTVEEGGPDPVDRMIHAQITITAEDLRANDDLAPLVKRGALAVVGAYYSLDTGRVQILSGATV
ncbi:carbonic anhydrase [Streptomyces sp. NPDC101733]|uniref:carbonic anhydrase n=1 Tax=unclassified Streptomyces TaxID=2593676 RepID=UPI00382E32B5